jgi:hypothetical protein
MITTELIVKEAGVGCVASCMLGTLSVSIIDNPMIGRISTSSKLKDSRVQTLCKLHKHLVVYILPVHEQMMVL